MTSEYQTRLSRCDSVQRQIRVVRNGTGARLRLADVPMHVIRHGNNRGPCFFEDDDYRRYLHLIEQFARAFGCVVHACVLACYRYIN